MQGYLNRSLRVYLLDDHDIVRQGLRDLLASAGRVLIEPATSQRVAAQLVADAESPAAGYTQQQRQVLGELVQGLTDAEIAVKLGLEVELVRADVAAVVAAATDSDPGTRGSLVAGRESGRHRQRTEARPTEPQVPPPGDHPV